MHHGDQCKSPRSAWHHVSRGCLYELERVTAADARGIVASINVDKKFSDYATRVNKVCRGTANCSNIEMTKDLWIDLEDFAKAFRKEVPGLRIPTSM